MNYLAAKGLRVCPIPDSAHPKWNDFGRAIDASGLRMSLLKGTCIVNHGRGPWGTHRFSYEVKEAAAHLLAEKSADFFQDMVPRIEYDTGISFEDEDDPVSVVKGLWAEGVLRRLKEEARLKVVFFRVGLGTLLARFRVWGNILGLGLITTSLLSPTAAPKAKNKAWFGIEQSFRALDSVWTILEETAMHAQALLAKLKGLAVDTEMAPWFS